MSRTPDIMRFFTVVIPAGLMWLVLLSGLPVMAEPEPAKEDADQEEVEESHSDRDLIKDVMNKIERLPNGDIRLGDITLNRDSKTLSFPGEMNLRRGPLEVLIATSRGRLHESLLKSDARPSHVQTLLYLLGLENGARMPDDETEQGSLVDINISWEEDGETRTRPIEEYIINSHEERTMKRHGWVFVGSSVKDGKLLADIEGNIALTWSVGSTVLDIPAEEGLDDSVFVADPDAGPPEEEEELTIIITPRKTGKDDLE